MPAPKGAQSVGRPPDTAGQRPTVIRKRTRSRELALQFLYQWDQRGEEGDDLTHFLAKDSGDLAVQQFARVIVRGVIDNTADIDEKIIEVAENWDIHRMAVVDRNVLRIATCELLYMPDVPPKVSINEAIDLAKKFSTAESGGFVNGILDKIRRQCGKA
ncbi:MAG: transcription antitermination factor NusB [Planctomycetes bacterium]|nr:transcription antitermination factor NusB [Planctomycetota bacterium]